MDTELLKTFLEVEKTRHFGRAADNLYLTPAAVSARIRQLEGMVGAPLLVRNKKFMGLTPAGERLKPRAREVLDALARAMDGPGSNPAVDQQLSIGGTPNLWEFYLAGTLQRLREANPGLLLRAECHDSDYLISQLQSRQLDAAFLFDPIELEGLHSEPVSGLELALFSTESGATAESARGDRYALVDWSVGFGIEHDRQFGSAPAPALFTSTGSIALRYLRDNGGSAYLPTAIRSRPAEGLALHPVAGAPTIRLGVYLLYNQGNRKLPLIESLRLSQDA